LPLAVVLMLASLSANIPRYFVEGHLGARELGLFSAASYLVIAGANVINAVGNAISPRLARLFAMGSTRQFARVAWATIGAGAAVGLAGALVSLVAGGPILELIYTREYAQADDLLTALALAAVAGFAASFAVGALTAAQEFKRQIPVFVAVVVATAAASALLIPRYGLLGAAAATAVSGVVQLVGCSTALLRLLRKAPDRG
jgi:O-antigen/teichoic acid export membrane protein